MDGFAELQRQVIAAGLMERRPLFFFIRMAVTLLLLFVGIAALFLSTSLWFHLIIAVYCAFVFGQIALLGHDAGHHQIAGGGVLGRSISAVCGFLVGISPFSWTTRHNQHHASPNREDVDPDINFPFLAYSEKQVLERRSAFARFVMHHQGVLYFPLLSLTSVSLRKTDIAFLRSRPWSETWFDWMLFVLHFVAYFGVVFLLLPWVHVLLFVPVHYSMWGFYMGGIFAPNHKGMPMLDRSTSMDFLREQVLTARNIRGNVLIDVWYGGLNYQIEHHLFPAMPRHNLRRAQGIVKRFCLSHGIPYHETGMVRSYMEILSHMRKIGRLVTLPA